MLRPFLAIAALGLLAMPVSATAKPRHFVLPAMRLLEADVAASNGYVLHLLADQKGETAVTAERGAASASYAVRGARPDEGVIKARLPGFGRVALRFHPRGEPRFVPALCEGRPTQAERGVFLGRIRFRGENGFTEASATRAKGTVTTFPKQVCTVDGDIPTSSPSRDWTQLGASSERGRARFTSFSASRFEPAGEAFLGVTNLSASVSERRRGVYIDRTVSTSVEAEALSVPEPERHGSATVTAEAPFSGSASYRAEGDGMASWTGTLSAEFPGIGEIRLAGPRFESFLCVGEKCSGEAPSGRFAVAVFERPSR